MREIIINKNKEGTKQIMLLENGEIVEKYEERENKERLEGNIYIGKVQNILQGMQAAFVDIGTNKNTFIHVKDIMPKVDEKKKNVELKDIKEVVKVKEPILIQVKKDSTHKKGARVSTHISLPGRYLVLMPNADFITISQKIEEEQERNRLLEIAKKIIPQSMGAIIRTSAKGKTEAQIEKDLQIQIEIWNRIQSEMKEPKKYPRMIHQADRPIEKILKDMIDQDIASIIVRDEEEYKKIKQIIEAMTQKEKSEIKLIQDENIEYKYEITKQLEKAEQRKIWLKCGGFITIDKTEALTAIDVNSGKYIGDTNLEQTIFTVNKEATQEIAKQIRLRDLDGIIIIDYIDMKQEEHKKKIIELLKEEFKKDRSKTQVLEFTKLNLLEVTRKHVFSNIE